MANLIRTIAGSTVNPWQWSVGPTPLAEPRGHNKKDLREGWNLVGPCHVPATPEWVKKGCYGSEATNASAEPSYFLLPTV
jgi:hypothetical protein